MMNDYDSHFTFLFFLISFIYSWPILEIFFNLITLLFYMHNIEWPHLSSDRGAYSPPTYLFSLCNVMHYACFLIIHFQPYHSKWLAPHKCQYSHDNMSISSYSFSFSLLYIIFIYKHNNQVFIITKEVLKVSIGLIITYLNTSTPS